MASGAGAGRRRRTPGVAAIVEHAPRAAALLKALGSEPRLLVLCSLVDGPRSVSEINARVPLSQSALSQHLAVLREAGVVTTRRESQTIHYSLVPGPARKVMAALYAAYCAPAGRGRRSRARSA